MGGKQIDKKEMALLVRLVIDKEMPIPEVLKRFDFREGAVHRFCRLARAGEFDYQSYLDDVDSPPDKGNANESEDRSIFAVAEMIDDAVMRCLVEHLDEFKNLVEKAAETQKEFEESMRNLMETGGARQQGFEQSTKNKIQRMEDKMDRTNTNGNLRGTAQ